MSGVLLARQVEPDLKYRVPGAPPVPEYVKVLAFEHIGYTRTRAIGLESGERAHISFGVYHVAYREASGGPVHWMPLESFGRFYGGHEWKMELRLGGVPIPLSVSNFVSAVPLRYAEDRRLSGVRVPPQDY